MGDPILRFRDLWVPGATWGRKINRVLMLAKVIPSDEPALAPGLVTLTLNRLSLSLSLVITGMIW